MQTFATAWNLIHDRGGCPVEARRTLSYRCGEWCVDVEYRELDGTCSWDIDPAFDGVPPSAITAGKLMTTPLPVPQ